jgi:autotransporter adhesin
VGGGKKATFINFPESLEAFVSLMPGTWIDSSASVLPIAVGGVHDSTAMTLTDSFRGYTITQSGSTWYGDLSMNAGTTFTADNLVASTIAATSITASNVVATTLSVTGNTTLGGTLNMSGNRITNVADGVNPTDAVNLRQLQQSQRESRAGVASVAAIAGIPTLSTTDDAVLGVGVGTFKGESSIAVGASKRFSDSTAIKFGVGANSSTGDVTGSFGIGIKW